MRTEYGIMENGSNHFPEDIRLRFAVILSRYNDKWVYCG